MCNDNLIKRYGTEPIKAQWNVVRGDTSFLKIEFFNNDEKTYWDTTGWTYSATAYDPQGDFLDGIVVIGSPGYVILKATEDVTALWGTRYAPVVAELIFDLQVVIPQGDINVTWTPVIGTIRVLGDVSPGLTL